MSLAEFPITNLVEPFEGVSNALETTKLRSKAIRLLPNKAQRSTLKKWFYVYRRGYNMSIKLLREWFRANSEARNPPSYYTFRKHIMDNISTDLKRDIKLSGIPAHSFANSIHDVLKNWKSANALKQKRHIKDFQIRYQKYTKKKFNIVLEPSVFSKDNKRIAPKVLKGELKSVDDMFYKTRTQISKLLKTGRKDHECRLTWDKQTGYITIYIPMDVSENEMVYREPWCSLDPGLRVPYTLYSPTSSADLGTSDRDKIKSLLDRIESRSQFKDAKWYSKFKKHYMKKIADIRDNMHWTIANMLVKSYDKILIGSMSTKSICKRGGNLNLKNKQIAYSLSNSKFKNRLVSKAEEYGSEMVVVNEYLTSKTCGGCFKTHNVGSSKLFNCPRCPFKADRDLNGARNIALNYFGLFKPIIRHRART